MYRNVEHLAIVGAGAGAVAALHALVRERAVRRITLVDRREPGTGRAFASPHPWHLCNTSAGTMSIDDEQTDHFEVWLERTGRAPGHAAFVPRSLYARYLRAALASALAAAARADIEVVHSPWTVESVDPTDGVGVHVVGATKVVTADGVVICTGTGKPRVPAWGAEHEDEPTFVTSPYSAEFDELLASRPGLRVLVLGTNLTAVDAVKSVLRAGGTCAMTSPSGVLPAVRTALTLRSPVELRADEFAAISRSPAQLRHGIIAHLAAVGREAGVPLGNQVARAVTTSTRLAEEIALARADAAVWQYTIGHLLDLANDVWSHLPRQQMSALTAACGPWIKRYVSAIPLVSAQELHSGLTEDRILVRTLPTRVERTKLGWRVEWPEARSETFDMVVCAAGNEPGPWSVDGRGRLLHDATGSSRPLVSPRLEVVNASTSGQPKVWTIGSLSGDRFPVVNYMRTSVRQAATIAAVAAWRRRATLVG